MKLNFNFPFLKTLQVALLPVVFCILSCQPAPQGNQFKIQSENDKIFGGELVTEKQKVSRHVVGIKIHDPHGQNQICSGLILSPKTILTAGHCANFEASQIEIIFGRDLDDVKATSVRQRVSRVDLHPQYLERRQEIYDQKLWDEVNQFDAAVLHLNEAITSPFKPIKWNFDKVRSDEPKSLQLAGFGAEFFDQLTSEQKGKSQLKSVDVETKPSQQENIIYFDQTQGKGSCVGDSGGPSFYEKNKRIYFVGLLVSVRNKGFAETCFGESRTIRLSSLYPWLEQIHRQSP
jgi:secreted trypsin-like serine protease